MTYTWFSGIKYRYLSIICVGICLLRIMGSYRREELSDIILDVAVDQELSKSGQLLGYRWMRLKCKQNGSRLTKKP